MSGRIPPCGSEMSSAWATPGIPRRTNSIRRPSSGQASQRTRQHFPADLFPAPRTPRWRHIASRMPSKNYGRVEHHVFHRVAVLSERGSQSRCPAMSGLIMTSLLSGGSLPEPGNATGGVVPAGHVITTVESRAGSWGRSVACRRCRRGPQPAPQILLVRTAGRHGPARPRVPVRRAAARRPCGTTGRPGRSRPPAPPSTARGVSQA